MSKFLIVGGAGFIGSQLSKYLLSLNHNILIVDNLSSGSYEHISGLNSYGEKFSFIKKDINDSTYIDCFHAIDCVVMLAANADIAKASSDPSIDFYEGTLLMQKTLEAMRKKCVPRIVFSSGSGVYGDKGYEPADEETLTEPISPYGANKLACEALVRAYVYMFDFKATIFRFGNVVGPWQTHGVCYDFIKKLILDPRKLSILGNGSQDKPYLHVEDVVSAINFALINQTQQLEIFNLAPTDSTTVNEIAAIVIEEMNLSPTINRGTERQGWKGDVPIVRLDSSRINNFGFRLKYSSTSSIRRAVRDLLSNIEYLASR
jgi:UDP-glucose 4-epimerase